ncbi:hypothetical protein ABH926_001776 [Catenulispora sp. GP43]
MSGSAGRTLSRWSGVSTMRTLALTALLATMTAGHAGSTRTARSIPARRAGPTRSAPTLRRPVTGRRLVRRRRLPVRPGRHGVGNGRGAGADPVSAGPAADAVGVGSEAGIGRRLATHPAKLPFSCS